MKTVELNTLLNSYDELKSEGESVILHHGGFGKTKIPLDSIDSVVTEPATIKLVSIAVYLIGIPLSALVLYSIGIPTENFLEIDPFKFAPAVLPLVVVAVFSWIISKFRFGKLVIKTNNTEVTIYERRYKINKVLNWL